ncbi:ATP-binding protein [Microbacterium sp. ARD32]|uniref:ATP-binding protein n=1 Tax=Microbacterium sp. ARD32 TaxID=2962577 RepID=UPI002881257C|nr:ATP-binding protein [Microbacterium sp. ARD32]MDT0157776.1 ATP-binding protein [Microbacterium sp. ARD32]
MTVTFDLARLRQQGTDDAHIEVKASARRLSSDVWDSVSAFANTTGGLIVLGLSESEGFAPVDGFEIDVVRDQFVEGMGDGGVQGVKLTNPPAYGMTREVVEGAPVLLITVAANQPGNRPCFVTAKGLPGGAYKRIDDKDVKLSATEVFEMQYELKVSDADRQIVEDADETDLDRQVLDDLIERRNDSRALQGAQTREEKLARLNVVDKRGGVRLAGLLATAIYPQQFYPRLLIDVTVHPGNEKSLPGDDVRFLDRVECTGRLADVVDDAVRAVLRNLRTYSVIEGVSRRELPEIPTNVIREAIANAVLHREYSPLFIGQPVTVDIFADRVEITNPGGLWGGVTPESLGDGTSRCRNQMLLPLMQHIAPTGKVGFVVEGQGSGIRLMFTEMEAHALARPTFSVGPDQVKVILKRHGAEIPEHREWLRQLTDRELTPYEDAALLIARRDGQVSVDGLRDALRIDSDEARRVLSRLRSEGVLRGVRGEAFVLADGAPLPSEADAALIRGLRGSEPQSVHEIAEWSGSSVGALRARLRRLVDDGWVQATAPPQSRNRKYVVRAEGSSRG